MNYIIKLQIRSRSLPQFMLPNNKGSLRARQHVFFLFFEPMFYHRISVLQFLMCKDTKQIVNSRYPPPLKFVKAVKKLEKSTK